MNYPLINALIEANISESDLAKRVGISAAAVSRYLSGKRTPNVYIAIRIAKVLKKNIDELWVEKY